jgi:hypothetical protein
MADYPPADKPAAFPDWPDLDLDSVAGRLEWEKRFRRNARETGNWTALKDIAHWWAVESGSFDDRKWIAAYRAFVQDALDEFFDQDGISCVLVLTPEHGFGRLTGASLRQLATTLDGDPINAVVGVLRWCYVPYYMAIRFLERWNRALSPELRRAQARHAETTPDPRIEPAPDAARLNRAARMGRGKRRRYKWGPFLAALRQKLVDDGVPERGDGGQAKLETWVRNQFPADQCPAQSVIRQKVAKEIAARRAELNG